MDTNRSRREIPFPSSSSPVSPDLLAAVLALAASAAPPGLAAQQGGGDRIALDSLRWRLTGDRIRARMSEPAVPSIRERVGYVTGGHWDTRQGPTEIQRRSLEIAREGFAAVRDDLAALVERISDLEEALEAAGAPWTPGRGLPPP